jgi:hypothetical protein
MYNTLPFEVKHPPTPVPTVGVFWLEISIIKML